jgi:hypothetical protein
LPEATDFSADWLSVWHGVHSGYWNGYYRDQGSNGMYWSSTAYDNYYAYDFELLDAYSYSGERIIGYATRCVATGGAIALTFDLTVTFNGQPATIVSYTDTEIVVKPPVYIPTAEEYYSDWDSVRVDVVLDNGIDEPITLTDAYEYQTSFLAFGFDIADEYGGGYDLALSSSARGLDIGGEEVILRGDDSYYEYYDSSGWHKTEDQNHLNLVAPVTLVNM